jgi:aldehyde:ferredoxin oxidoreductase
MAGGYTGKILMVDLSKGEFRTEEPGDELYQKFLAGVMKIPVVASARRLKNQVLTEYFSVENRTNRFTY